MQRVALALLLVLGGCLAGFAQNSKPSPITKEVLELRLVALERDRAQAIANVNAYDGAIQECQFWLELLKDAEQEEAMVEFPKWKYHREKKAVVVNSAEEEKALGPGWADSPADFKPQPKEEKGRRLEGPLSEELGVTIPGFDPAEYEGEWLVLKPFEYGEQELEPGDKVFITRKKRRVEFFRRGFIEAVEVK